MASQASKYGSLPFLDSNEKDVFETEDASPSDATTEQEVDEKSDPVDILNVSHSAAYGVFQNKQINTDKLDFSDQIPIGTKTGYTAKTIYEIIGEDTVKETPQQKLQRLKLELNELAAEVASAKESDQKGGDGVLPVSAMKEVAELQHQLKSLNMEAVLGTDGLAGDGTIPGTWTKEIKGQLQNFQAKPTGGDKKEQDCVTYELYYKPETSKFAIASKASELEKRLHNMESIVGGPKDRWSSLLSDAQGKNDSLLDAVNALQAKLSLVDTTNLDVISVRLQGVLHHISQISAKKEAVDNAEQQSQISELHEMMQKWDSIADAVPELIQRLKALSSIHQEGSDLVKSLVHLQTTQESIREQLTTQKGLLQQLETTFADNTTTVQKNCTSLDERITALLSKMEKKK